MSTAARKALDAFLFTASFRWFAWYLGTFTLALIVIGFVVLGVRAARTDSPAFLILAATVPVTALYIALAERLARPALGDAALPPDRAAGHDDRRGRSRDRSTALIREWQPKLVAPAVVVVVAAILLPAAAAGRPFVRARDAGRRPRRRPRDLPDHRSGRRDRRRAAPPPRGGAYPRPSGTSAECRRRA